MLHWISTTVPQSLHAGKGEKPQGEEAQANQTSRYRSLFGFESGGASVDLVRNTHGFLLP